MLVARKIRKSFYSDGVENRVLKDVSLSIEDGDFVCVVGRSGSGKSTLLNVMSTLLRPDGGSISFNGRDITRFGERDLGTLRRRDFAIIFQHHPLMPYLTAVENVLVPFMGSIKRVTREQTRRALSSLEKVGLGGKENRLPGQLSGGEQQRVSIARALVKSPSVIFADEPTGNLDRKTGDGIVDLLKSLNDEGLTVIMVTHETSYKARATKVVEMTDGVMRESSGGRATL